MQSLPERMTFCWNILSRSWVLFRIRAPPYGHSCPFTRSLALVNLLSLQMGSDLLGEAVDPGGKSNINYWIFRHLVWSASVESYSSPERGWRTWTQTQTFTGLSFRWTPTSEFFIFWFLLVFCNLKMKHSNIHSSPLLVDLLLPVLVTLLHPVLRAQLETSLLKLASSLPKP